jgi:penicillin G amidase
MNPKLTQKRPQKMNKYRLLLTTVFSTIVLTFSPAAFAQTEVPISGLSAKVTVRRDARSIPYIEAANDTDLYFAQGFETARDRLWQMDLLRRVARGETAEIFGKQSLEEDKRWRRFGFAKIADDSISFLSPELRAALEAYAKGVNAYIAALDDKTMPAEFRILQYKPAAWKPSDTVMIGKILADGLSTTWRHDVLKASLANFDKQKFADLNNQVTPYDLVLFGQDAAGAKTAATAAIPGESALAQAAKDEELRRRSLERVGLYMEDLAASNNWVISGSRTADGKPILANDPHLPPTVPGIWYMSHLSTPSMRVSGVTLPGVPGIVLGHNEYIAWGATNVGPDVQDLYLENMDTMPAGAASGGASITKRTEVINVRTSPLKTDTEPVNFEVTVTRHGPVIVTDGDKKYALKWTAFDPKNIEFEAFFMANRAKNWEDVKNALRTYGGATQNFVYADVKGNIGWYAAGRIPIRRTGDGSVPYDGATNDGDWIGYIPFEELPNLYNPKSGLIVTANQRTTGTNYKYHAIFSRDAAMPWRARRIYDRLSSKQKLDLDDARDAQLDIYNIPLAKFAKQIVDLNAAAPETIDLLKSWDGNMSAESKAPLIANEIRNCIANAIAAENKPVPASIIRERVLFRAVGEQQSRWLPASHRSWPDFFRGCEAIAKRDLAASKRYGSDETKWTWGMATRSTFAHPLAVAPLIGAQFVVPSAPLNGSGQTPNVASSVSMRHIASPGNWDATRHVIPMGQSGDPRSPNYKDQFEAWRTGIPMIFPFSKQAVEAAVKHTVLLVPKN